MENLKHELHQKIDKLEKKVDTVGQINNDQNVILGKMEVMFERQQQILDEHQRRSFASEKRIKLIEDHQQAFNTKFGKHLSFIQGAVWFCGALVTLIGVIGAVSKLGIF